MSSNQPLNQNSVLSKCDYYARKTVPLESNNHFTSLVEKAKKNLAAVVRGFALDLDLEDNQKIQTKIAEWEDIFKYIPQDKKAITQTRIQVLKDFYTLNNLSLIGIPNETNNQKKDYCILPANVGGVTEKITVIQLDSAVKQLKNLSLASDLSFENYLAQRDKFVLNPDGIIKKPKHGKSVEVQREAMALSISRILGLQTTQSAMLAHNDEPGIFIPFDNITLLQKIATGKHMRAKLMSLAEYSHYSTLNPVGELLQPEEITNDFGNSLGFFYLCSDTDAWGGYNQNKAVKENKLYIFDQVLSDKDKLGLDSRLNMRPISSITKHTRHDQGRNRTIVEDSLFDKKFDSLTQLIEKAGEIDQYFNAVIEGHKAKINALENTIKNGQGTNLDKEQLQTLKILLADAETIQESVAARIKKIDIIFPKNPDNLDNEVLKKTLLIEKLFNKPRLFTDEGRPYRHLWTEPHEIQTTTVAADKKDNNLVYITFNKPVSSKVLETLKLRGGKDSIQLFSPTVVRINKTQLLNLKESDLYPETDPRLQSDVEYLNKDDLSQISLCYGEGHRARIQEGVKKYLKIQNSNEDIQAKMGAMDKLHYELEEWGRDAKDPGFINHVLKKLQFDMQQRLQKMIPVEDLPDNLTAAFNAAAKLDQLQKFNQVVQEAIRSGNMKDPDFTQFLKDCITKASQANNHQTALQVSYELKISGTILINKYMSITLANILAKPLDEQKEWTPNGQSVIHFAAEEFPGVLVSLLNAFSTLSPEQQEELYEQDNYAQFLQEISILDPSKSILCAEIELSVQLNKLKQQVDKSEKLPGSNQENSLYKRLSSVFNTLDSDWKEYKKSNKDNEAMQKLKEAWDNTLSATDNQKLKYENESIKTIFTHLYFYLALLVISFFKSSGSTFNRDEYNLTKASNEQIGHIKQSIR